jgi:hypothetical protein
MMTTEEKRMQQFSDVIDSLFEPLLTFERGRPQMPEEAPWEFEYADSLQHHIEDLTTKLGDEIIDEDVEAVRATTERIYAKVRELRRELRTIAGPPKGVDEPDEEGEEEE